MDPEKIKMLKLSNSMPLEGCARVRQIVGYWYKDKKTKEEVWISGFLPIALSTWFLWVRTGKAPKPAKKLGPHCTLWDVNDIFAMARKIESGEVKNENEAA